MADWQVEGEALLAQGNRAWEKGDMLQAEVLFRRVIEEYPERPEGYNKLGVVLAETRHLEDAEQYFLRAIAQDRNYAPALTNLGNIYLERGETDAAIQHYMLALQSNPDYPAAHRNLSVAFRRQGKYSQYVRSFKRFQRLDGRQARTEYRQRMRSDRMNSVPGGMRKPPSKIWPILAGIGAIIVILSVIHR